MGRKSGRYVHDKGSKIFQRAWSDSLHQGSSKPPRDSVRVSMTVFQNRGLPSETTRSHRNTTAATNLVTPTQIGAPCPDGQTHIIGPQETWNANRKPVEAFEEARAAHLSECSRMYLSSSAGALAPLTASTAPAIMIPASTSEAVTSAALKQLQPWRQEGRDTVGKDIASWQKNLKLVRLSPFSSNVQRIRSTVTTR
jgi:hypothetical protein